MTRGRRQPAGIRSAIDDAGDLSARDLRAGRDAAIANLDRTIDSLIAALRTPALATPCAAALNDLLKDAIVVRAEIRHLQVDWQTVASDMADLKDKMLALNSRLAMILHGGQ
jgi:hypothetical protein